MLEAARENGSESCVAMPQMLDSNGTGSVTAVKSSPRHRALRSRFDVEITSSCFVLENYEVTCHSLLGN